METEKTTKKFWIILLCVCTLFLIFTIVGFIIFSNRKPEIVNEQLDGGTIDLSYTSDSSYLNINGAVPTTDEVGMVNNAEGGYFDFSVNTEFDDAKAITYELSIKKVKGNVSDDDIIIYLEKEDSGTYSPILKPTSYKPLKKDSKSGTKKNNMILITEEKNKSAIDNYRLRTWISDKSSVSNGIYQLEINIFAKAK